MELTDCKIWDKFICAGKTWKITDIGVRTIIAIRADKPDWVDGPPYALAETVFDENDLPGCKLLKEIPMTWNHRVIRHEQPHLNVWFAIHECYYTNPEDEIPHSWTERAVYPSGDTLAELSKTILRFEAALCKPILEIDGDKLRVWNPEQPDA